MKKSGLESFCLFWVGYWTLHDYRMSDNRTFFHPFATASASVSPTRGRNRLLTENGTNTTPNLESISRTEPTFLPLLQTS